MEREKRLITVGHNSRQPSLLKVLTDGGYTLNPYWESTGEAVILPIPYSEDGVHITGEGLTLAALLADLPAGSAVLGGRFDREAYLTAGRYGARLFDYFTPEGVQIANAALTAKAALKLAAERLRKKDTKVLVCGFGRIGRCLMNQLTERGADATVSLRKDTDAAWADALGYRWVHTDRIDPSAYELIFNTVPSMIFTEERLNRVKPDCLILDLASAPYGVDFQAAKKLGVKARAEGGLPGKFFPEEAGRVLGHSALTLLRQVEDG